MPRVLRRIERWIYGEFPIQPGDWSISRVLLASYLLVVHLPRALAVPDLPDSWYDAPLSLAAFTTSFPPYVLVATLNVTAFSLATFLLYGIRPRITGPLLTCSLVLLNTLAYSTGKIDHDLLVVLAPSLFAVRLCESRERAWVLSWLALVIALFMSQSGAAKLRGGWLSFESSATYGHMTMIAVANGGWSSIAKACALYVPHFAWEMFDWSAVLFELSASIAVIRLAYFRIWCVAAALFHLGVGLLFEIWFAPNIIAYAFFVPWTAIVPKQMQDRVLRSDSRLRHVIVLPTLANWSIALAAPELHIEQFLNMTAVLAGAAFAALLCGHSLVTRVHRRSVSARGVSS